MKLFLYAFIAFFVYTLLAPFAIVGSLIIELIVIPLRLIGGYIAIYQEVKRRLAQ